VAEAPAEEAEEADEAAGLRLCVKMKRKKRSKRENGLAIESNGENLMRLLGSLASS
jgi:hypothetical protein